MDPGLGRLGLGEAVRMATFKVRWGSPPRLVVGEGLSGTEAEGPRCVLVWTCVRGR